VLILLSRLTAVSRFWPRLVEGTPVLTLPLSKEKARGGTHSQKLSLVRF